MTMLFSPDDLAVAAADIEQLAKALEAYETPTWAAESILDVEILTQHVIDPCVGRGVLADAAKRRGYYVTSQDIYDWGYKGLCVTEDWLDPNPMPEHLLDKDFTVFLNPPFSKACEFVDKAFAMGARKVVCFQRYSWFESLERRQWFEKYPPARIWLCGERATCWRFDLADANNGMGNTPTSHAWFVWERGHKGATVTSHIWKRGMK